MRDAFAVLFFVSVGMLFDPALPARGARRWWRRRWRSSWSASRWPRWSIVRLLGYPVRVGARRWPWRWRRSASSRSSSPAWARRLGLCRPPDATNTLVAAAIVSITLNPLLYRRARLRSRRLPRARQTRGRRPVTTPTGERRAGRRHRAVVIGYGPVGRTVSAAARARTRSSRPCVEMNLDTVRALRRGGHPRRLRRRAASRRRSERGGAQHARRLDPERRRHVATSKRRFGVARELNPHVQVLVRADVHQRVGRS